MERLGAPGGVDGGLAESSGSLGKRKRSQTPQDNCPPNETGPASSVIKIDESSRVLFRIAQSSFESRLQNWVKSAADESEKKNRLEAQCTILDAKKNKAKNLDLSFLDLTDVPPLDDLTQLEKLNLSYNQLEALPKGYFTGLNKLRELDLRNNQLSTLPEGCSNELNCLRILYLDGNQLNTLPEGCFKELNLLEELGLDDNKLRTLEPNCFSGLNSLRNLYLADNQLTELLSNTFNGLTELCELHLSRNQLKSLEPNCFAGCDSLDKLFLNNNLLSTITISCFDGLDYLWRLYLDQNYLKNGDELNLEAGQFKIVNQKTYENLMEEIEKELMTTFPRILKTLRRREEIGGRFMSSEQRRLLSRLDHLNTIKNSWPNN